MSFITSSSDKPRRNVNEINICKSSKQVIFTHNVPRTYCSFDSTDICSTLANIIILELPLHYNYSIKVSYFSRYISEKCF